MADNTIIQQGRFTSTGEKVDLAIRSDVDWMEVVNLTQWSTTQATGRGVKFFWRRGLSAGEAFEITKADSTNALQGEFVTSGGFTLLDESALTLGAAVTGTTITKADPPVATAAAHGYSDGDLVLLSALDQMRQLSTVVWEIGNVATNTFELTYMDTNTANFTAASAFVVRRVPKFTNWVPPGVVITAVTTGATTGITLSATVPSIEVGQTIRINMPDEFGMTQIDGLSGEITAINTTTNTLTVGINSTGFTAFAWPDQDALPMSYPRIIPFGTTSGTYLGDAVKNTAIIGMTLGAGIDGPAGSADDVIYWTAGKSFSVTNE